MLFVINNYFSRATTAAAIDASLGSDSSALLPEALVHAQYQE